MKRPAPLPAVFGVVTLLLFFVTAGSISSVAAVELGTLTIQSQPEVEVIWDGVFLGTTDASGQMLIGNIPPGTYALTFSSPGFTSRNESVDITPGRQELDTFLAEVAPPAPDAPEPSVEAGLAPARDDGSLSGPEPSEPSVGAGLAPARDGDVTVGEVPSEISSSPQPPPTEAAEAEPPIEAAGPVPAGEGGGDPQDHIATTAFLVVAAVLVLTAFLLADRRSRRQRIAAQPEGPRLVVPGTVGDKKKLPTFYDDLKRRETDLEDLVDVGSGRTQRQVIDIQVEDHGPVKDDS